MKSDIDHLMQAYNLDAFLVTGSAVHNPAMVYFTGRVHLSRADLIKKQGEVPVLFFNSMERDEAAKTGLATRNPDHYNLQVLLQQTGGDAVRAAILRYCKMFTDLGLTAGRVAVYGMSEVGQIYTILSGVQQHLPGLEFVGEMSDSMLLEAMSTKDDDEVARIRRMGQITTAVVGKTADFLTSQRVKDEILIKADGAPITIGEVKRLIDLWLAELGAENPEGTIFAIGRDAAVPHSAGADEDVIRLGRTIVFDIFPCEKGGGYYYDFTRTWCLGYAPDPVQSLYEDVLAVYRQIMSELKLNAPCRPYQERTCELFETRGHPTIKTKPTTQEGYVHSLGHGVGLHIHERPWFGMNAKEADRLAPGVVVTIEPGLYYPEKEMSVRLEDTVWVRPDGQIKALVDYPLDLILPMRRTM